MFPPLDLEVCLSERCEVGRVLPSGSLFGPRHHGDTIRDRRCGTLCQLRKLNAGSGREAQIRPRYPVLIVHVSRDPFSLSPYLSSFTISTPSSVSPHDGVLHLGLIQNTPFADCSQSPDSRQPAPDQQERCRLGGMARYRAWSSQRFRIRVYLQP